MNIKRGSSPASGGTGEVLHVSMLDDWSSYEMIEEDGPAHLLWHTCLTCLVRRRELADWRASSRLDPSLAWSRVLCPPPRLLRRSVRAWPSCLRARRARLGASRGP